MVYKFFDKKFSGGVIENEIIQTKELAEELHKSIIKKNWKKESTFVFYRHYLECWSSRYAIDK